MTVNDNNFQVDKLGSFFKNFGKISAKASKKLATIVLKNPGRALEMGANVSKAAACGNPKNVLSTLVEMITFYHKGRCVYLGKFIKLILYKRNKKRIDYTHQHHIRKLILSKD